MTHAVHPILTIDEEVEINTAIFYHVLATWNNILTANVEKNLNYLSDRIFFLENKKKLPPFIFSPTIEFDPILPPFVPQK